MSTTQHKVALRYMRHSSYPLQFPIPTHTPTNTEPTLKMFSLFSLCKAILFARSSDFLIFFKVQLASQSSTRKTRVSFISRGPRETEREHVWTLNSAVLCLRITENKQPQFLGVLGGGEEVWGFFPLGVYVRVEGGFLTRFEPPSPLGSLDVR